MMIMIMMLMKVKMKMTAIMVMLMILTIWPVFKSWLYLTVKTVIKIINCCKMLFIFLSLIVQSGEVVLMNRYD